jgi:hypothetical protein
MNDERHIYDPNISSDFNLIDIRSLPSHAKLEILNLDKTNVLINDLDNIYFQGFVTICDSLYVVTSEESIDDQSLCHFNSKLYLLEGLNWKFLFGL